MLSKRYRVNSSKEFDKIYRGGSRYKGQYGMLLVLPSPTEKYPRFGFIVGKKVGNAVVRHRITRWLRNLSQSEIRSKSELLTGSIFSYIAYKTPSDYNSLRSEFVNQIEKFLNDRNK